MNISTPDFGAHTYVKRGTLITALCLSTLFLASCGGGSDTQTSSVTSIDERKEALAVPGTWTGRAPRYEVINGITVPPEPAPSVNNATLAGVDINNNGVRDDVERAIAQSFGLVSVDYQKAMSHARTLQAALVEPNISNVSAHIEIIQCLGPLLKRTSEITKLTLNTGARRNSYGNAFADVELGGCK